ncbi:hypothetical protein Tsubulata_007671 [Turnera subulata]|uniref:Strictosidine synthase conserved region domain-containing protein n=1 Tax=Turnera subulata TaxID=218843 RepID=A0A9Q0FNK3_9ROSI|nr:hypothetical protein Tsubulata_007671 [Turnera subulata]
MNTVVRACSAFLLVLVAFVLQIFLFSPISSPNVLDLGPLLSPSLPTNNHLQKVVKLGEGYFPGPEDVIVDKEGVLYTATRDGWIKRMYRNGSLENWKNIDSEDLLGIAFSKDGGIIVCDAEEGLLRVNEDGVTVVASHMNGSKIRFADEVIESSDGSLYFSVPSTKFGLNNWYLDVLEARPYGQILKYDPMSKETSILVDGLAFANGVALSSEEDFLGREQGKTEIFIDNLPGGPDNINLAPDGSFWIGLLKLADDGLEFVHKSTAVKYLVAPFPKLVKSLNGAPKKATVINVAADGKIIRKFDDPDGSVVSFVTSAFEFEDHLYLGSLNGSYKFMLTGQSSEAEMTEPDREDWDGFLSEDSDPEDEEEEDPFCPTIRLSSADKRRIYQRWKQTLIIKLLGKKVGYRFLHRTLMNQWKPKGEIIMADMGNDFYLLQFHNDQDYDRVLYDGPWIVADHVLTVRKWQPRFDLDEVTIDRAILWRVGRLIKVNEVTLRATRVKYARVCVEVDLTKPLLSKFHMHRILAACLVAFILQIFLYSPISPDLLELPPAALSKLPTNKHLQDVIKLGEGFLDRPEDVAVDKEGVLYTATRDGWIKRLHRNGTVENWKKTHGNDLLGITVSKDGSVVVCDAEEGLLRVNEDGTVVLTSHYNGSKLSLTDEVVEASDGSLYFSVASSKFGLHEWYLDFLEAKPHGKLLKYDPSSHEASLVLDDLCFPNGVALSRDEDYLIFCESWKFRCTKYWLKGENRGKTEIFIDNLPGAPDNILLAPDGSYWIALVQLVADGFEFLSTSKTAKHLVASFPRLAKITNGAYKKATVVNVGTDGKITRRFDDPDGKVISFATSALQHEDYLYLGSLNTNFIGKLPLKSI